MSRFLLVSTPRSGNTYLRRLLATTLGCHEFAVHRPSDVDWESLPPSFIGQIHWHPTPELLNLLERHQVTPLVLHRHPLDVLVSILHFSNFEPQTANWLNGEWGDETRLLSRGPRSADFVGYSFSMRAETLLNLSLEWTRRDTYRLSYEDLVADPAPRLIRLLEDHGIAPDQAAIAQALATHTLEQSRTTAPNRHFWRGQPGLWTQLIDRIIAQAIEARHQPAFHTFGYDTQAARRRSYDEIDASWNSLY